MSIAWFKQCVVENHHLNIAIIKKDLPMTFFHDCMSVPSCYVMYVNNSFIQHIAAVFQMFKRVTAVY